MPRLYCPYCDTWDEDPQDCKVCAARKQAHWKRIQAAREKRLEYDMLVKNPPSTLPTSEREEWIAVEAKHGHYAWQPQCIAGHYDVFSDMRGGMPRAGSVEPGFHWQLTEVTK